MSSAIRNRLWKGHKFLISCQNVAVRNVSKRCSLVSNSFNFQKIPKTPKFNLCMVANCSNVPNDSKVKAPDECSETKILEDDEIQNILRDFAKDFDVDEESSKILEDIKRTQTIPEDSEAEAQGGPAEAKSLEAYRMVTKQKFREFEDADNQVVLSFEEENQGPNDDFFFHIDQDIPKKVPVEAKRGVTGVYDIHELVEVLYEENLYDITVIKIPSCYHYADHMVLANAKSVRHLIAASEHILKFYKQKKDVSDPFVNIEGEKLSPWKAIDMGNIVLHLFLEDTRSSYDIESLWLFDREFDTGGQNQEGSEEVDILKEQMEFLESIQLSEASNVTEQQLQP